MSVFNKKEDADQEPVGKKAAEPTAGKGRPTPKRKDAQAQNLRPLVPKDREASRKAAKARMRERENAEYDAMQKGDINHMPKSERRRGVYTSATTSMPASTWVSSSFRSPSSF